MLFNSIQFPGLHGARDLVESFRADALHLRNSLIADPENRAICIAVVICSLAHVSTSFLLSSETFHALREGTGLETVAYRFYGTGASMNDDALSQGLCFAYAHVFGVSLIVGLYVLLGVVFKRVRGGDLPAVVVVAYVICLVISALVILCAYPSPLLDTADAAYNYAYALEWRPMYWHGFLTNVFHCAALFAFQSPVSLPITQSAVGLLVFFYLAFRVCRGFGPRRAVVLVAICAIFAVAPGTLRVLQYVGRNYSYAIVFAWFVGTLLLDARDRAPLTHGKMCALAIAVAVLAAWRTEGVLLLAAYPLLVKAVYQGRLVNARGGVVLATCIAALLALCMYLPGVYGSAKYHGGDYAVMNTPGPLSEVLTSKDSDLTYAGVDDDLESVDELVPLEYIVRYRQLGTARYNSDQARSNRQLAADASAYLTACYRILGHNVPIWLKYQAKLYANSIGFSYPMETGWDVPYAVSEEGRELEDWIVEYWALGRAWVSGKTPMLAFALKPIAPMVVGFTDRLYGFGWALSPFVKLAVVALVAVMTFVSMLRRRGAEVLMGSLLLLMLVVIVMSAPAARPEYYYYVYAGSYWYLIVLASGYAGHACRMFSRGTQSLPAAHSFVRNSHKRVKTNLTGCTDVGSDSSRGLREV